MSPADHPTLIPQNLNIPQSDWQQTPESVQTAFVTLLKRVEALEARLNRDSSNSSRPPSTDSSAKGRNRRKKAIERQQAGPPAAQARSKAGSGAVSRAVRGPAQHHAA